MKILLTMLALTLLTQAANAQKFKEWFRQNRTQRQYLKEQIVQFKLYLELTKQGYKIAKQGLGVIHQIKNAEFKLHQNRFDSLRIVKSGISSLSRLQHITDLAGSTHQVCEKLPSEIASCQGISTAQKKQMLNALAKLYDDSQVLIGAFLTVIRDGAALMSDDQRILRIEGQYKDFEANYTFAQELRRELGTVCRSTEHELKDIDNRRLLRGIK